MVIGLSGTKGRREERRKTWRRKEEKEIN